MHYLFKQQKFVEDKLISTWLLKKNFGYLDFKIS